MKKCLVFENIYKDEAAGIGSRVVEYLNARGISVTECQLNQYSSEEIFSGYDFVVTLGGDGSVLYAARGCAPLGIPVFPVNLGQFGFIAGVQKENWEEPLSDFLSGKIKPTGRNMMQAEIVHDGKVSFFSHCLNDIVITSTQCALTMSFDVVYNRAPLGHYKADGIIAATATGSTAYSVSAGGPIVDPELDAFVLTPLNSFSLSSRPLVFNPEGELVVSILPDHAPSARVIADGQKTIDIVSGDSVVITKAPQKVLLVGCSVPNFYAALRSKFNWAGGPHA